MTVSPIARSSFRVSGSDVAKTLCTGETRNVSVFEVAFVATVPVGGEVPGELLPVAVAVLSKSAVTVAPTTAVIVTTTGVAVVTVIPVS